MSGKRRTFSADFKASVARDAMREADTLKAVAARHGIHPSQVKQWRERFEAALDAYAAAAELLPADDERQAATAFERAVILLTTLEDHLAGLEALEAALEAGFDDRERLAGLLAAERLVRREAVQEAVAALFPELAADDTPDPTAEPPAP